MGPSAIWALPASASGLGQEGPAHSHLSVFALAVLSAWNALPAPSLCLINAFQRSDAQGVRKPSLTNQAPGLGLARPPRPAQHGSYTSLVWYLALVIVLHQTSQGLGTISRTLAVTLDDVGAMRDFRAEEGPARPQVLTGSLELLIRWHGGDRGTWAFLR